MSIPLSIGQKFREYRLVNKLDVWENELMEILGDLLVNKSRAVPAEVWEKIKVNSRGMWIDCFTHYSYDVNNNYEMLETFGDSLLASGLYYSLIGNTQEPEIAKLFNSTNVSSSMSKVMMNATDKPFMKKLFSNHFSGRISQTEEPVMLYQYIRSDLGFEVLTEIMEDVMEAFLGCLQLTVDKNTWGGKFKGPGFASVVNFVQWLYLREAAGEMDLVGIQDIKSFMKEVLEKVYGYKTEKAIQIDDNRSLMLTMKPQEIHMDPFEIKGREVTFDHMSNGVKITKDRSDIIHVTFTPYKMEGNITLKGYEPRLYEAMQYYIRTVLQKTTIDDYDMYRKEGKTTYILLKNIIDKADYDNLIRIVKDKVDPTTIDFKRKIFNSGNGSFLLWGKSIEEGKVGQKVTILKFIIQKGYIKLNDEIKDRISKEISSGRLLL